MEKIVIKKLTTINQYLLANRSTSLFGLVATLVMTEFNTATLFSFSGLGYLAQNWGVSLILVFFVGLIFYALTVAKKWKQFNGLSVAHFFSKRYTKNMGYFVSIILFLAMTGFTATYLKSLTLLFKPLIPHCSAWSISALMTFLIMLFTLRGGLLSIIRLDRISFCFTILFFPMLAYFSNRLPSQTPHLLTITQMHHALPPRFLISLIILTMFSYILAPWYGQKIVAAKSTSIAFTAVLIAASVIAILYGIGIWCASTLSQKGILLHDPEMALSYLIHHALPKGAQVFADVLLFFISATTLAGVWNAMVTLLLGESQHNTSLNIGRALNFCCLLLTCIVSNCLNTSVLNSMILANIPIIALSFTLLAGFYWRGVSTFGCYVSISVGIVWGIYCVIHYGEQGLYTWYWAIYGIPLIFLSGIISSYLSKNPFLKSYNMS